MTTPPDNGTVTVPVEPTPGMLEPFARVLCMALNLDPDEPEAPHGEWPTWYGQCGPLAAAWTAALAAAPSHPEPKGWRTIDSAPRDGTPILITRPTAYMVEEGWHVVRWDEDDGGWVCHDGKFDTPLRGPEPSHWQPLPEPPVSPEKGEG